MSNDVVISVENLSKRYRIGVKEQGHKNFRNAIMDSFTAPVRNLKRLRRLTKFDEENSTFPALHSTPSSQSDDIIWALRGVSFEVKQGQTVGIIGRNGTGKSTLLKILSRITEPTSGDVKLFGRVSSLLEVGTGFHPELTGRENVYLNGTILGMRKTEVQRKFDEIVSFSGIDKFIDTPVKFYSSGMKVRLAFAVAAHLEPEILLVDEVLAVGDAAFQKRCLGKMGEVAKRGRTVLFVSHRMDSIRRLCKVAYWLHDGKVRQGGPANEVVNSYERQVLYDVDYQSQHKAKIVNDEYGVEIRGIHVSVDASEDPPTLRVDVKGRVTKHIGRFGIGIQITTLDGILVSKIGPRLAQSIVEDVLGDWEAVFQIKNITHYLAGGEYVVQLRIRSPQIGIILEVENAAIIQVPATDVHKVGAYISSQKYGLVPLPVQFSFREL